MTGKTISEKILSAKSRTGMRVPATSWSVRSTGFSAPMRQGPMSIAYFDQMGGRSVRHPERVAFALDHYSPPSTPRTQAFHDEVRAFGARYGVHVYDEGEGISHQIVVERGEVLPGELVIGADSHTVTCGALGLFATGVGSSDLAAAMITGQTWLRVPETIQVVLSGALQPGVFAKDIALEMVRVLGAEGANYRTLELSGSTLVGLSVEERLVLSNLAVESGAKAAIVPADDATRDYLAVRTRAEWHPVASDADARFEREIGIDVSALSPQIALPHAPDHVVGIAAAVGTPIHMVFLGTCTGGRVSDFHEALAVLERGGVGSRRGCSSSLPQRRGTSTGRSSRTERSRSSKRWARSSPSRAVAPAVGRAA